jgi:enoyl-CoA hydratase
MFRLVRNHLRNSFSTVKETPVLFEYQNNAAKVILNKPKALNALDLEMIRILQKEINKWNNGQDVKVRLNNASYI